MRSSITTILHLIGATVLAISALVMPSATQRRGGGAILSPHDIIPEFTFYNPVTNATLSSPIVTRITSNNHHNDPQAATSSSSSSIIVTPRLPFIGQPCSCGNLNCGCCAGVTATRPRMQQRQYCTNFSYDPLAFALQMNVLLDDNSLYQNQVSGRNPSPVCVPVPVPYVPLYVDMCVKLFNIFMPGRNLHLCMDWLTRVQHQPVMIVHFECVRMGANGFAFVSPDQNGGLDLEALAAEQQQQQSPPPQQQQEDSDVFNPVWDENGGA